MNFFPILRNFKDSWGFLNIPDRVLKSFNSSANPSGSKIFLKIFKNP
jgi:hypothetical protein